VITTIRACELAIGEFRENSRKIIFSKNFDIVKNFKSKFFKRNRISLFSFYDNDHGPVESEIKDLCKYFKRKLSENKIPSIAKIKVLCLPRIMGYVFNPISVFVCYDKKNTAKAVVFEVNNTFKERHLYLCKTSEENIFSLNKKFYVSPFFKVQGKYKIKFSIDRDFVNLFILYEIKNQKVFEASFKGRSKKMSEMNLVKLFFQNFFQNLKATSGIYIQALKLFIKGATYIRRPKKPDNFITKL